MNIATQIVPGGTISPEVRETFERDGVALVRNFVGPEWLDVLAEAADEIRQEVKKGSAPDDAPNALLEQRGESVYCENGWRFNEKLRRFAFESGVARLAAEAMASKEARLFETLSIYKEQGADTPTYWHQDWPQHGQEGTQACSVWLSLEPVTEKTSALRFVPGSHKGPWYTPDYMPPGREHDRVDLPGGPVPDPDGKDRDRFPPVRSYDSEPGDVILLHPNCLHNTLGNPNGTRRRTFSIRFIGDDTRRKAARWEWHTWLKDLPLKDGDKMRDDEMFPLLWPRT